jgi:glycine betaine/proline transport system substrate-binding protein
MRRSMGVLTVAVLAAITACGDDDDGAAETSEAASVEEAGEADEAAATDGEAAVPAVDPVASSGEPCPQGEGNLRLGDDAYVETQVHMELFGQLAEELGYTYEQRQLDIGLMYPSIIDNDMDVYVYWLPGTHADYWAEYGDQVDVFGPIHDGARIGLVVPEYVSADIASIEDLNANRDLFDARIVGSAPGSGIEGVTADAIAAYGLDFEQVTSSQAAQVAEMQRSIEAEEPILIAGYQPQWWYSEWELRFLADPMGAFGGSDSIYPVARQGFADEPGMAGAACLLANMAFTAEEHNLLTAMVNDGMSPAEAAAAFLADNPDYETRWLGTA